MRRSEIRDPNSTKSPELTARKSNTGGNYTFAPLLRVTEVELGELILLLGQRLRLSAKENGAPR
ncbi:MAG: hypothetical protein ACI84D_003434 [Thalassolituus oleivorans]|jgi:hypothetical protein